MQGLRAETLFKRDVEYVVQDGKVKIIDEFTGRILPGRRSEWAPPGRRSEGGRQDRGRDADPGHHHDSELLPDVREAGGYDRHGGDGGDEFREIYGLDVDRSHQPARAPCGRNDVIYKTQREKYKAVVDEMVDCHSRGQPVLVGTVSVDKSELLAAC